MLVVSPSLMFPTLETDTHELTIFVRCQYIIDSRVCVCVCVCVCVRERTDPLQSEVRSYLLVTTNMQYLHQM